MKKILVVSIALLMASGLASAQNLSLVYEGNPIPANQTIGVWGPANGNEMIIEVEVTNNSNSPMDVLAKKVENSLIEGSVNTFCWAGQCYPPFVYVSPNFTTIPAGATTAVGEFSGHYNPSSNPGQSSISYVFFDNNNPNDSVMVTVLFYTSITGITSTIKNEFTLSEPYPNPANDFVKFDYDLNHDFSGQIKIYSLVGSLVKEMKITDQSGTIEVNTDKFEEGFYFYVFSSSGKEIKTGRFIVSH
jgi:hypothetical protein